jgi:polyisoprenoid-binding protein YceI
MIAKYFLIPLFTIAATAATSAAQGGDGARLELRPESELSFEGTSTLHAFHCRTNKLQATMQVDPSYTDARLSELHSPLKIVEVVIPVKSLTCGNKGLEENMFKTLKADQYPEIRYELTTYEIRALNDDGFTVQAVGKLKIAGKESTIDMKINAERLAGGNAKASGTQELLMTDFGIKPPVFMLGALRTGNKVVVTFNLMASPRAMATLAK